MVTLTSSQRIRIKQLHRLDRSIYSAVIYCIKKAPDLAELAIVQGIKAYVVKSNQVLAETPIRSISDDIMIMLGQEPVKYNNSVRKPTEEEIERGYKWALGNHQPRTREGAMPLEWKLRRYL